MKYKVEIGAHVTRYVSRVLTVSAKSQAEAEEKAKALFAKLERALPSSVDAGTLHVNDVWPERM